MQEKCGWRVRVSDGLQLWDKLKFQADEALLLFAWNILCNRLFLEEEEEEESVK